MEVRLEDQALVPASGLNPVPDAGWAGLNVWAGRGKGIDTAEAGRVRHSEEMQNQREGREEQER
eukprot:198866-Chlamydomonas_euryale.AAC.1